jgi:hypothetical protein
MTPDVKNKQLSTFQSYTKGMALTAVAPLSKEEHAAIYAYSSERPDRLYKSLNCYLNNKQHIGELPMWVKQETDLLKGGLAKIPLANPAPAAYRGTHMLSTPKIGDMLKNLGFLGASTNSALATAFAGCNPCYRLQLVGGNGKLIHQYTEGKVQTELLYPADVCWRVTNVELGSSTTLRNVFAWATTPAPATDVYVKLEAMPTCTGKEQNILEIPRYDQHNEDLEVLDIETQVDDFLENEDL